MGSDKNRLMPEDELSRKISKWVATQQRRRNRAARFQKIFDVIWNKFFWFLR